MGDGLGRSHVRVGVGGQTVEIAWSTQRELLKLLRRSPGALDVVLHFENVGANRPVELDGEGNRHLLRVLIRWLDHPGFGKPFPDDARVLWSALADHLEQQEV